MHRKAGIPLATGPATSAVVWQAPASVAQEQPRRRITYADYAALDDERRYQVFSGILIFEPAPTTSHQQVVANLFHILADYIRKSGLGGILLPSPVDVVLDPEGPQIEVLQPDILWIQPERAAIVKKPAVFGAPDLVVEVLSPTNARRDRTEKLQRYRKFGVAHIWLVDFERHIFEELIRKESGDQVLTHHGQDTIRPHCFPHLALRLSEVWPTPVDIPDPVEA